LGALSVTSVTLTIHVTPASLDKRITGINVYRKDTTLGTYSELFRFCGSIDMVGNVWSGSTTKEYVFTDDGTIGATFEANSGLLENVPLSPSGIAINYGLNAQMGGYYFIADCYKSDLPDGNHYIFRSKRGRYDTFDFVNDSIVLPNTPTALIGFNNRIYAFDNEKMYVIDPENLYIETVYNGWGCISQTSAYVTLYGLFFCNKNNCYLFDGKEAIPIGDAIKVKSSTTSSAVSWQSQDFTVNPIVVYDSIKGLVLFITKGTSSQNSLTCVFAYNPSKKRWDYYDNFSGRETNWGAFAGKDGEVYLATGGVTAGLLQVFAGSTKRAWEWRSKNLTFDSVSQYKKFFRLIIDKYESSGTITATYSIDGGSNFVALTSTDQIKASGGAWEYQKGIIIKLAGGAGVNFVNAITILYRTIPGIR